MQARNVGSTCGARPSANRRPVKLSQPFQPLHRRPCNRPRTVVTSSTTDEVVSADVVIVGAGIVGLFTAEELLRRRLSVVLLERKGLCAGATGAGQGYLWMAHRAPGSAGWALAARSLALWRRAVEADPAFRAAIEWQGCGSLLIGTTETESAALSDRQLALNGVGLRASFLDAQRLADAEPGLVGGAGRQGGGLLVQSDLQINGRAAARVMLERCRSAPGFTELMGPEGEVRAVEPEECGGGEGGSYVVHTHGRRIHARHALVLTAGVWTGSMLAAATSNPQWAQLLTPRRGHLLEMPRPPSMPPVVHGMMEMSYTKHYAAAGTGASSLPTSSSPSSPITYPPPSAPASAPASTETTADITFTATTSASGSLLIGSSREFSGWDTAPRPAIVAAILSRASAFLPGLAPAAEAAAEAAEAAAATGSGMGFGDGSRVVVSSGGGGPLSGLSVRVGLRPYAVGGLPLIGPVQGAPGLFVAAGHEGSGLCMGPATAELLSRHIRAHIATTTTTTTGSSTVRAAAALGDPQGGSSNLDTSSFQELLPDTRRKAAVKAA